MSTKKEWVIEPVGGLCNRIRVVFSNLVKARINNMNLVVIWEEDKFCNGFFLDYFEPVKDATFFKEVNKVIDYQGCYANHSFEKELYYQALKELKLNIKMEKEVNKFINRNLLPIYNAVHIRRTDFVNYAMKKNKFMINEEFEDFIHNNNKNKVFIATDDKESQNYFSNLPNTIYFKPIQESTNKRQTSLEQAIIDLFICVRCKKFLGTRCSSYSELIKDLRKPQ